MSTRRPWEFRTAPTTAILDQPDVVRQESWHTSAFRLESRLSTSSSVQNIIGSSMGRPVRAWQSSATAGRPKDVSSFVISGLLIYLQFLNIPFVVDPSFCQGLNCHSFTVLSALAEESRLPSAEIAMA